MAYLFAFCGPRNLFPTCCHIFNVVFKAHLKLLFILTIPSVILFISWTLAWCSSKELSKPASQTDLHVDASQRKFAKPELAYGFAKGGQRDSQVASQVASQVHSSRKNPKISRVYRRFAINLCRLVVLGGQTVKKFALSCVRIWARPKSTQASGQMKRKLMVSGFSHCSILRLSRRVTWLSVKFPFVI